MQKRLMAEPEKLVSGLSRYDVPKDTIDSINAHIAALENLLKMVTMQIDLLQEIHKKSIEAYKA